MFLRGGHIEIEGERCLLRLPKMADHLDWVKLRRDSEEFLRPWEPVWARNHFSKQAFRNRVFWARKSMQSDEALPLFIFDKSSNTLVGAVTLDNIRRGPAQSGVLGYWIGQEHARKGFMHDALHVLVGYAFAKMNLSRIEAATLPENKASRALLEKCGFKYEGVAQSYLQIDGRWRNHVLYANLRNDRRGKTEAGA